VDGFLGMDIGTLLGQFTRGEAAMLYVDQGYLTTIDAAREEGLLDFEVSAFPTPQPDAGTFSQEVVDAAGPIADDGENYGAWATAAASVRQNKDENQVKMAVDFLRYLTTPAAQEIYVNEALNLPVNPSVEPKDPRIKDWLKNPKQIEYKFHFFGDRPTWYSYMEGFLLDQITVDELIAASNDEMKQWAETEAREADIELECS
jgi:ABC-type glycerol-3-phosphate transport system substrate-binding protein